MAGTTQVSRALCIVADDGLGQGELTKVPVTEIGSGELLLRASHSSVNNKDALAATGRGKVVRRRCNCVGFAGPTSHTRHMSRPPLTPQTCPVM
jgi:NADPH:quinone reductase-like Zn-dependent oxidoreductase